MLRERTGVRDTGQSQRPPEGAAPLRQCEAGRIRMHVRSPTRQSARRIGEKPKLGSRPDRDEPQ
ncbi:hypothetical protein KRMM14A1259_28860 [Krasilnikovia sp. MM14-A1259]